MSRLDAARLLADAASVQKVEVHPGCWRQTLVHGQGMMLCLFTLRAGTVFPLHAHAHEQAGYVIAGRLELQVDGTTVVVSSGASYYFRSGEPHGARVIDDAVVLDVFSPPREDYL